jgi:ribosome-associated protein
MAEAGIRPQRVEGAATSGWIVLDFGDVLVHIFSEDQREFYRLEDLWAEAPTLLAIQ